MQNYYLPKIGENPSYDILQTIIIQEINIIQQYIDILDITMHQTHSITPQQQFQNDVLTQPHRFRYPASVQIQYKQNVYRQQSMSIGIYPNCIQFNSHRNNSNKSSNSLQIQVDFQKILSVAKNTKNKSAYTIVIFVNEPSSQSEEQWEQEEQDDSKQAQLINKLLHLQSQLQHSQAHIKVQGNVTINICVDLDQHSGLQNSASQLQRQMNLNASRDRVVVECQQLYEGIIARIKEIEKKSQHQGTMNSNLGINKLINQGAMQGEHSQQDNFKYFGNQDQNDPQYQFSQQQLLYIQQQEQAQEQNRQEQFQEKGQEIPHPLPQSKNP